MYIIKQKEHEAIRELTDIVQTLNHQSALDKREFNEAKSSARKAQFLVNLILDRWEEERTYV